MKKILSIKREPVKTALVLQLYVNGTVVYLEDKANDHDVRHRVGQIHHGVQDLLNISGYPANQHNFDGSPIGTFRFNYCTLYIELVRFITELRIF